jgi:hypothetical protein
VFSTASNNQRRLQTAEIQLREKTIRLIRVGSHEVTDSRSARRSYEELSRAFAEEIVLVASSGSRHDYYGDPLTVRQIVTLKQRHFDWRVEEK